MGVSKLSIGVESEIALSPGEGQGLAEQGAQASFQRFVVQVEPRLRRGAHCCVRLRTWS